MPKGTPLWPKCPRCKDKRDTHKTGQIELAIHRSAHKGHGSGGQSFIGHRGQMRCGVCGHTWYSTHSWSGRIRCRDPEACTHREDSKED